MEKRPTHLSAELRKAAALATAEALIEAGRDDIATLEEIASDIERVASYGMDGYALAKALDDRFYWDCDLNLATDLDCYDSFARDEIKKAQEEWAEKNDIKPPFPVGSSVEYRWGSDDYTGTIAEISSYDVATYLIRDDKANPDSTGRHCVLFEHVKGLVQS